MVMFSVFIHIHIQVFMQSAKIFFKQNNFAFQVSLTAKLQFTVFEIYVWVSMHHKLIYIKNQRDATWQYVY